MAQTKYLDLTGLGHFWTKVKEYITTENAKKVDKTTKVNGHNLSGDITVGGADITVGGVGAHASKTIQAAINDLDAAVKAAAAAGVLSIGGQAGAITLDAGAVDGSVKLAVSAGKVMSGSVTGWSALVSKVDSKASQTALDTANGKITALESSRATKTELSNAQTTLQSSIDTKANKTAAVNKVQVGGTVSSSADAGVTVKVDLSGTMADTTTSMTASTKSFVIPAAKANEQGVVTLNKITEIAASEAGKAATSAYKVKGTKATLAEVLAVSSATIGDVYNITAEFVLVGKKYPAGTNVVFIGDKAGNDPKQPTQWDALGGTVDLTPYATTSALTSGLSGKVSNETYNTHVGEFNNYKTTTDAAIKTKLTESTLSEKAVTKFGGQVGEITLKAGGTANGSINLTMSGKELQAAIVGLGTAAYQGVEYFALRSHKHTIADVTGLQEALNTKLNSADLVALSTSDIDTVFALPKA